MKCLVTGATGYIGRHLCQQLLARGDSITALSKTGAFLPGGTPTRAIDLASMMPERGLLEGVDVVFHLAGIAHQSAPASAYRELNELATLRLARLSAAAGVGTFVFLSSVKAMGPATHAEERSEQDCTAPADPYGWSKWSAENALQAEFARTQVFDRPLSGRHLFEEVIRENLDLGIRRRPQGQPGSPGAGGAGRAAAAAGPRRPLHGVTARPVGPDVPCRRGAMPRGAYLYRQ